MQTFFNKYKGNDFSQNGEDLIIAEIINRLKDEESFGTLACEFGAGDGHTDSNTAKLVHAGWTAVYIEADPELFKQSEKYWGGRENMVNLCSKVTPGNVNFLVPPSCTILSIDIDGNDYNVWKALRHNPAVVIIEINSGLHPLQDHVSLEKGSNFSAMVKLGQEKGYFLLCHTGNLIFIDKLFENLFPEAVYSGWADWDRDPLSNPSWGLLMYPLENVQKFFNTAWLTAEMIRDWEKPAAPVQNLQPVAKHPVNLPAAILNSDGLPKIGVLVTATWKFTDFLPQFFKGLKNFVPGHEKFVFLFTDNDQNFGEIYSEGEIKVIQIQIPTARYPEVTLWRYKRYIDHQDYYRPVDYLFHLDVDMQVVQVGPEILKPLVAVQHPLFIDGGGSFENQPRSAAHIGHPTGGYTYVCGGVQGGDKNRFIAACGMLMLNIEYDQSIGVTATWHDEGHWNWYCARFQAHVTILDAGYCYPQEKALPERFKKHIIALDKDKRIYR